MEILAFVLSLAVIVGLLAHPATRKVLGILTLITVVLGAGAAGYIRYDAYARQVASIERQITALDDEIALVEKKGQEALWGTYAADGGKRGPKYRQVENEAGAYRSALIEQRDRLKAQIH